LSQLNLLLQLYHKFHLLLLHHLSSKQLKVQINKQQSQKNKSTEKKLLLMQILAAHHQMIAMMIKQQVKPHKLLKTPERKLLKIINEMHEIFSK
jgi:hypothetical protein